MCVREGHAIASCPVLLAEAACCCVVVTHVPHAHHDVDSTQDRRGPENVVKGHGLHRIHTSNGV